jgi:hypothetical protein
MRAEKNGWLADKTSLAQLLVIKRFRSIGLDDMPGGIDMLPFAIDHAHVRMLLEIRYSLAYCPGQQRSSPCTRESRRSPSSGARHTPG